MPCADQEAATPPQIRDLAEGHAKGLSWATHTLAYSELILVGLLNPDGRRWEHPPSPSHPTQSCFTRDIPVENFTSSLMYPATGCRRGGCFVSYSSLMQSYFGFVVPG